MVQRGEHLMTRRRNMRIVTTYFDCGPEAPYDVERMLRAFLKSAKRNGVSVDVNRVQARGPDTNFFQKMESCRDYMKDVNEPILFVDCDMLVFGDPLQEVFQGRDVVVTSRYGSPPLNCGVFGISNSDTGRRFLDLWLERMHEIIARPEKEHKRWINLFGALDQAALGQLIMCPPPKTKFQFLPQVEWNCADAEWEFADLSNLKFLHVKGRLRETVLGLKLKSKPSAERQKVLNKWAKIWKTYDEM
jgi:hypothetical protein